MISFADTRLVGCFNIFNYKFQEHILSTVSGYLANRYVPLIYFFFCVPFYLKKEYKQLLQMDIYTWKLCLF